MLPNLEVKMEYGFEDISQEEIDTVRAKTNRKLIPDRPENTQNQPSYKFRNLVAGSALTSSLAFGALGAVSMAAPEVVSILATAVMMTPAALGAVCIIAAFVVVSALLIGSVSQDKATEQISR